MTIEEVLAVEEMQVFDRKSVNIAPKVLAIPIIAFANADGGTGDRNRRWNKFPSGKNTWTGRHKEGGKGGRKQSVSWGGHLCGVSTVWNCRRESIHFLPDNGSGGYHHGNRLSQDMLCAFLWNSFLLVV